MGLRYMGISIPVQILMRCNSCNREQQIIKWFPDDHWKELSEVETIKCGRCGDLYQSISYELVEISFRKHNNKVWLCVGRSETLIMSLNNGNIQLHLSGLPNIPYLGSINVNDGSKSFQWEIGRNALIIRRIE